MPRTKGAIGRSPKIVQLVDEGTDEEIITWALARAANYIAAHHKHSTPKLSQAYDDLKVRLLGIIERRKVDTLNNTCDHTTCSPP